MVELTVHKKIYDPYKNFKFRVKWDGRYVAGVNNVSRLWSSTEVVGHRQGSDPSCRRESAGRTKDEPITLEHGVIHDAEFMKWVDTASHVASGQSSPDQKTLESSPADFRKDIMIDLFNESGQKVVSYKVYRCWVSKYCGIPQLDPDATP